MPGRKEMRGAASGLLGAFVSRNNDVGGYWALGKLYALALKSNAATVSVDLLNLAITPADSEFTEMVTHFTRMLMAQLSARQLPVGWLKSAFICVEFGGKKSLFRPGDLFDCTVRLVHISGRAYEAHRKGACWAHDPAKERRSTRF